MRETQSSGTVPGHDAPVRVLVVDDNEDLARGLAEILGLAGYDAAVAYDGPEGLELARRLRPRAALLDIGLPGMDGYQLAGRLREELGRDLLLVAVTGYGREEDRQQALAAGFDHHHTKPARLADLLALLPR